MDRRTTISTGLALFAMFFGAGNIIFPLHLGATSGQFYLFAGFGCLLTAVGVPFLGLYATSLFHGDYDEFFDVIGKVPAFLVITFLIIMIGPLFALPRTETITFHLLDRYLPPFLNDPKHFSLLYCGLVFALVYRETRLIDILGFFLSPIKLVAITTLVIVGIIHGSDPATVATTAASEFERGITMGYGTMDLMATFFFCTVAYNSIMNACQGKDASQEHVRRLTLQSCVLGATVLSLVYVGFMILAHRHSIVLQGLHKDELIGVIAENVLGNLGGLVVGISISFACIGTAMALAEVSSIYLHRDVFRNRVPRLICLIAVMVISYFMSLLGFDGIMAIAFPILRAVYPALIVLCVVNIIYKQFGINFVKVPFFLVLLIGLYHVYSDQVVQLLHRG